MAIVTLKKRPITTAGKLPAVGSKAPEFKLTRPDLTDVTNRDFEDIKVIINIVPSLDTDICSLSARAFNERVDETHNTVVLTVSNDLPFAQSRFCKTSGVKKVLMLAQLRDREFGADYGVTMLDGPLEGLLARAVVVIDTLGKVAYTELVPDIGKEPDYDAAFQAARSAD